MSLRSSLALLSLACLTALPLPATDIVWPTSLDRASIKRPEDYLQPTVSGRLESATFGMVREDGKRFHEGIDIRPAASNADGEPLDLVLAAMDGQVAYLNPNVNGPYGKYVVLFHGSAEIPVYTLYAHLAKIQPALKVGANIPRGSAIGLMGHTSSGATPITKERAHLHFEIASPSASCRLRQLCVRCWACPFRLQCSSRNLRRDTHSQHCPSRRAQPGAGEYAGRSAHGATCGCGHVGAGCGRERGWCAVCNAR